MTWREWSLIWLGSIAFTALVVGLAFFVGAWTLGFVFLALFVGIGFVVTAE